MFPSVDPTVRTLLQRITSRRDPHPTKSATAEDTEDTEGVPFVASQK
jgi:hypothetical protein